MGLFRPEVTVADQKLLMSPLAETENASAKFREAATAASLRHALSALSRTPAACNRYYKKKATIYCE